MGIADFVQVTVSLSGSKSPTRQGFGVPLLAGFHTHYADRVRVYSSATALTQMVSDGFVTTEPIYRAMEVALAQSPAPAQIAIGRRALGTTQVLTLTMSSLSALDTYQFTVVGTDGVSHAVSVASTGVIATDATTLAATLTALTNVGTVSHTTTGVTFTSATPGSLVDLNGWASHGNAGSPILTLNDASTDPGIATDLAAIVTANPTGWYGLALDSNSHAEIAAAAAWVEATGVGGKVGFYNNSDAIDITSSSADAFSALKGLTYKKAFCLYSGKQVLSYSGFGLLAQLLALNPGSYAASYKSIAGALVDDDVSLPETGALLLNSASTSSPGTGGKNGNYYKLVSGLNVTWPGSTPAGGWIDTTIFVDWFQANLQADIFAVLAGLPKVPFTDAGIGLLADAVRKRFAIGASSQYGGIDATQPIVVTVPAAAAISITDLQNRNLSGLSGSAKLSGAINTTTIGVNLTP